MTATHLVRLPFYLVSLLLALIVATPAPAADFPTRKVTVIGNATIKVVPDQMLWVVQVSITDSTPAKAKARHDSSLADALKFLKSLGSAIKDLQTGGIRFDKNLYPGDNADARKNPYSCTTQITFTLTDFDKYGPIADGLAKLDGLQVQSVDYASSKADALKRDALKQALVNAHDKASDLAVTGNCYIDKPLEIIEGINDGPHPVGMLSYAARGGGTPAPVAGQIEINAAVTATYDMYFR